MTGNPDDLANYEKFDEYDNDESHMVTLADQSIVKAAGKGNLNVYLKDSEGEKVPVTFKDVLYIPKMKRLISVGQLTKAGGEVTFRETSVRLNISGRNFCFGTKFGKLYSMNYCNFAAVENRMECDENKENKGKQIEPKNTNNSESVGVMTESMEEESNNEFEGVNGVKFSVDENECKVQSCCAGKTFRARSHSDAIRVDTARAVEIRCADTICSNAVLLPAHVDATPESRLTLYSWGCSYAAVVRGFH
jgi:hypothetical protein